MKDKRAYYNNPDTIWFTSDTHFGHENIIRFTSRPFQNFEEMDQALIDRWNAVVKPTDTVFHLGDFCYRNAKSLKDYRNQLNGKIVALRGNHDRYDWYDNYELVKGWGIFESVHDYLEISVADPECRKRTVVLFHYPIYSYNRLMKGDSIHCYGHVHEKDLPAMYKNAVNVSVEKWNYTPVSYRQILETVKSRQLQE